MDGDLPGELTLPLEAHDCGEKGAGSCLTAAIASGERVVTAEEVFELTNARL